MRLNKYFCFGIWLSSFTWIVSIIIYTSFFNEKRNYPAVNLKITTTHEDNVLRINFNQINKTKASEISEKETEKGNYTLIRNKDDLYVRDIGYKQHAFNVHASNNIGLYRKLPDTRHKLCKGKTYDVKLKTSVIMCFYNEDLITLLRSVNTIIERTPSKLLHEIILIDDFSQYLNLKKNLINELKYLNNTGKLKLFRNDKQEGLIRSRIIGSKKASGDVLVFFDSHIEVNQMWLEPLLNIITSENTTLAVPVIDIIDSDTFTYSSSPLVRGGFNWGLHFKWDGVPSGTFPNESSLIKPYISPTMAGGLYAINRKYFIHIGEYDDGMDLWGGENLEISFRIWMCGGSIKIIPCSRVGHVFRKRRPYGYNKNEDAMIRNSLRLAYVWMDNFKNTYLQQINTPIIDFGNIEKRIELRKNLKCKSFSWYLQNIYPELEIPGNSSIVLDKKTKKRLMPQIQSWNSRKRNYINEFLIKLSNYSLCVATNHHKVKSLFKHKNTLSLQNCKTTKEQTWYETEKSEIVFAKLYCLETFKSDGIDYPVIAKCHEMRGNQEWHHINTNGTSLYNAAAGTCLTSLKATVGSPIILNICDQHFLKKWELVPLNYVKENIIF